MKKPKTLKGWQKIFPSAIKVTAKANTLFTKKQIIELIYPDGSGKVLHDCSSATWSSKGGTKANINAIVCSLSDWDNYMATKTQTVEP